MRLEIKDWKQNIYIIYHNNNYINPSEYEERLSLLQLEND